MPAGIVRQLRLNTDPDRHHGRQTSRHSLLRLRRDGPTKTTWANPRSRLGVSGWSAAGEASDKTRLPGH